MPETLSIRTNRLTDKTRPKEGDRGRLGQQEVVGDEKKELTKILKMYIRAVAWRRNCRTILVSEI